MAAALTRAANDQIFQHLLRDVAQFPLDQNGNPHLAERAVRLQYHLVTDFAGADLPDLETLEAPQIDATGQPVNPQVIEQVPRVEYRRLQYLKLYLVKLTIDNGSVFPDQAALMAIDRGAYDNFRITTISIGVTPTAPVATSTEVATFKKGIKRDPSLFPELKDMRYFDKWKRSTLILAHAQNVQNVFCLLYTSPSPRDA